MCKYHIIFCPKYRYKILSGETEVLVRNEIYKLCGYKDQVEIEEINIQEDHVHLIISIPPKYSVSEVIGYLKGKLSMQMFRKQPEMKKKYWGRHIWSKGYCASTVGLDEKKIKKYVKWKQEREPRG